MSTLKVNNIQNLANTVGIDASTSTIHTTSEHAVLEGSSSVSLVSNSINALGIDSSGIITKPNTPAFHAKGSGNRSFASPTRIDTNIINVIEFDNLSNYNTSNQRFTAPVSGIYLFFGYSATTTSTSTGPVVLLMINGSSQVELGINYNAAYYNTYGGVAIRRLEVGEYAQLCFSNYNNTSFTVEMGRSRFGGFLIG